MKKVSVYVIIFTALTGAVLLATTTVAEGTGTMGRLRPGLHSQPRSRFLVGPAKGVEFRQVDLFLGRTPILDSDWGEIVVNPTKLVKTTSLSAGYVNVLTPHFPGKQ